MKMKKLKSLFLAICLLVTCMPSTVFAKDTNEEIEAALLATPRYIQSCYHILDNSTGFTVANGNSFNLFPNTPYYLILGGEVKDNPSNKNILRNMVIYIWSGSEVVDTIFVKEYTLNTPLEFTVPTFGGYTIDVTNFGFDTWLINRVEMH